MLIRNLTFVLASLLLEAPYAERFAADSASAKPTNAPRSLTAIQVDVHAALRDEASARRAGDNTPQVLRLVDLYREMAAHPQHEKSFVLRELGQQVRARLTSLKDHINRHTAQSAKKTSAKVKVPAALAAPEKHVLAQQLPAPAKPANQPAAPPPNTSTGARPTDYGQELVALIEATISPDTWNINGGPGTIIYYTPRRAMVVNAPDDVHGDVRGALGQLRAAGQ